MDLYFSEQFHTSLYNHFEKNGYIFGTSKEEGAFNIDIFDKSKIDILEYETSFSHIEWANQLIDIIFHRLFQFNYQQTYEKHANTFSDFTVDFYIDNSNMRSQFIGFISGNLDNESYIHLLTKIIRKLDTYELLNEITNGIRTDHFSIFNNIKDTIPFLLLNKIANHQSINKEEKFNISKSFITKNLVMIEQNQYFFKTIDFIAAYQPEYTEEYRIISSKINDYYNQDSNINIINDIKHVINIDIPLEKVNKKLFINGIDNYFINEIMEMLFEYLAKQYDGSIKTKYQTDTVYSYLIEANEYLTHQVINDISSDFLTDLSKNSHLVKEMFENATVNPTFKSYVEWWYLSKNLPDNQIKINKQKI